MKNRYRAIAALLIVLYGVSAHASFAQESIARETTLAPGKISMSFDSAPLVEVLKIFSQQTGFNFVSSQEVETKKVTVYLEGVDIQDALDSIMRANDLHYRLKEGSNVFVVYAGDAEAGLETRVFQLKYARVSISPMDVGGRSTITSLGAATSSTSSSSSSDTSSSTSSNLTAEKGIDKVIASLLSKQGKIIVNLDTNSLIVTDIRERLSDIEKVLKQIDVPPLQVMIEVYLMEVRRSLFEDHGVDWGGSNGAIGKFTAGTRTSGFPFTENIFNQSQGVKATTQGTSTLTLGTLDASSFTATLRVITTDTKSKILARPRVMTMNKEAASIKLTTNTALSSQTTTIATASSPSSTTAERTETGISLKMTPQINEENSTVGLYLEPSVTTVATSTVSSSFLDPTTRSIRTMAQVKDNETLVIGGLIDSDRSLSIKKIPLLGDIPGIGNAFKYKNNDDLDRELLIFITPHIIRLDAPAKSFKGSLDALSMNRMMKSFRNEAILQTMDPIEEDAQLAHAEEIAQENAKVTSKKHKVGPLVEKEMSRTLDAVKR